MLKKQSLFYVFFIVILLTLGLMACAKKPAAMEDILTQKVSDPHKIPVTVLVKYAFSIHAFEKAAEERFPQLDIIQVGNYTADMGIAEYEARLKNDDLTDIVMTWPLDVGEKYWNERLLDLSALPISSKYTTSMLNTIARDGKLFYLPGPSQVRAIVYNKTLFKEKGWAVPTSFEGFIELCKKIEQAGIRPLQLSLKNEEVLDTAFVGFGYASSFAKPENAQWMDDYNQGKGSFGDNFTPALRIFQRLVNEGILQKSDLNVYYQDRERMLFTRQAAMAEDSVLMARMGLELTGSNDEFGLMPFFNPTSDSDWARLYPVCFIGVNKHLTEAENKEKYDLVMQLLEYISTPEGQEALAGDTGAMFSSLKGVSPPNISEIKDLIPALTHGRYAVFPTLKNAQEALREGLAGMVAGTLTSDDVIKMVDAQNISPPVIVAAEMIGTAEANFSLIETGNFLTDAMRERSGSDIALFLDNGKDGRFNGKGISGRLYKGDLTVLDVKRVLPDLKHGENGELWKITMTGADLIHTLEHSIPVDNDRGGWFYYFSGLRVSYAPAASPGTRIQKITDAQGQAIDPNRLYAIAVMDDTVPEAFIKSCEKTGILINDILKQVIVHKKTIAPSADGRFTVIGS